MKRQFRIVARTNGVGIDRDVAILAQVAAAAGMESDISHHRSISPFDRFLPGRDRDDCIIFLERVKSRWLSRADRFILMPNQERFAARLVNTLEHVDNVFAKTRHAQEIFERYHPHVTYTGFTSLDRRTDGVQADFDRFFHLAGGSSLKGTDTLLDVWSAHPHWPVLHVLYHRDDPVENVPPNVDLVRGYVSDEELSRMQNAAGIHLCPSLSEGWGHSIVEAMSCGAVVVTTDGPPMNEIVGPDRGILVPWTRTEPRKLGTNFHVDPAALADAVNALIRQPESEKRALGDAARAWYERNDREFRERLGSVLENLVPV